jgi:uncharacterized membrane protein YjjP (DUF1212 family)
MTSPMNVIDQGRPEPPAAMASLDRRDRALLADLGNALVATGQPVHEVEQELTAVARRLGHNGSQIAATPTGVTICLRRGGVATYQCAQRALRLDQAIDLHQIVVRLTSGQVSPAVAITELSGVRAKAPRYPGWVRGTATITVAVSVGLIAQPGVLNVVVGALAAVLVAGVIKVGQRRPALMSLVPTVAAFAVGLMVFSAAQAGLLHGPLRTVIPPLLVLLPGRLLVTGMAELAAGEMLAGSSRLIYGVVQLLLLAFGIITAAQVTGIGPGALGNVRVDDLGPAAALAGLALLGTAVCLRESAPIRVLPWVIGVLLIAAGAQWLGQAASGPALGGFLSATAASVAAALCEVLPARVPRLVTFLPALWLLVPGTLGLLSVTQLAIDPRNEPVIGVEVVAVFCAVVIGMLVGSALVHSLVTTARPSAISSQP